MFDDNNREVYSPKAMIDLNVCIYQMSPYMSQKLIDSKHYIYWLIQQDKCQSLALFSSPAPSVNWI